MMIFWQIIGRRERVEVKHVKSVQGEREGSSRSPVKRAESGSHVSDASQPFSLSHWMLFVQSAFVFLKLMNVT